MQYRQAYLSYRMIDSGNFAFRLINILRTAAGLDTKSALIFVHIRKQCFFADIADRISVFARCTANILFEYLRKYRWICVTAVLGYLAY